MLTVPKSIAKSAENKPNNGRRLLKEIRARGSKRITPTGMKLLFTVLSRSRRWDLRVHANEPGQPLNELTDAALFVAQSLNGIEIRGADCGEHTAPDADQRENPGRDKKGLGSNDQADVACLRVRSHGTVQSKSPDR